MKKVLFIGMHRPNRSPSQRYRFEQYFSYLKENGIQCDLSYLISEQGQKQFAEVNREYPTREGVAAHPDVPAAGSYKIANVPMVKLGEHRNETIDLIEKVGMP